MATAVETLRTRARETLDLPPEQLRPWALPGAAALLERRWQLRIKRAPIITGEEDAARVGVKEIEEVIGCSLCGETRMQPLLDPSAKKRKRKGKWAYHVVRCPTCGFLYRHPGIKPERLGDLYANEYSSFLQSKYEHKRTRRYRLVLDAFDPLFADGGGRRLFDFGCGHGLFLQEAHRRGFDGYGVDLSPDSIDEARKHPWGQNAYFGAPMDVPEIAAGGFDAITLMSVLAHLATPVEDFKMLRGLLNDDGVLLVLTVNANSLGLKWQLDAWNGFTPNHLKFFSPTTLPRLLKLAGFEAVVFRPMYGDTIEAGTTSLSERNQRRLKRNVDAGNRGNMMRAVAFADADGPKRWGLEADAHRL